MLFRYYKNAPARAPLSTDNYELLTDNFIYSS